jgi:hypothetical protein
MKLAANRIGNRFSTMTEFYAQTRPSVAATDYMRCGLAVDELIG